MLSGVQLCPVAVDLNTSTCGGKGGGLYKTIIRENVSVCYIQENVLISVYEKYPTARNVRIHEVEAGNGL